MRILAPAKINLDLRVSRRDASGYHPLSSWLCTVALFDTLTIRPRTGGPTTLRCDDPSVPTDETNLVLRAVNALQPQGGDARLEIVLEKRIPAGAGMGGGSSDAARTLLALNQLWKLRLPLAQVSAIAETLGSDVPFFLHGPSSFCTGRGQFVKPVAAPRTRWALLIVPPWPISTAAVYSKFDELQLRELGLQEQSGMEEWTDLSAGPLLARLNNDLEPAAFALCPQLRDLRDALEATLGRVIRMTGSGSTLFTLFDEQSEAESAGKQIVNADPSLRAIPAMLAPRIEDDLSK